MQKLHNNNDNITTDGEVTPLPLSLSLSLSKRYIISTTRARRSISSITNLISLLAQSTGSSLTNSGDDRFYGDKNFFLLWRWILPDTIIQFAPSTINHPGEDNQRIPSIFTSLYPRRLEHCRLVLAFVTSATSRLWKGTKSIKRGNTLQVTLDLAAHESWRRDRTEWPRRSRDVGTFSGDC